MKTFHFHLIPKSYLYQYSFLFFYKNRNALFNKSITIIKLSRFTGLKFFFQI